MCVCVVVVVVVAVIAVAAAAAAIVKAVFKLFFFSLSDCLNYLKALSY